MEIVVADAPLAFVAHWKQSAVITDALSPDDPHFGKFNGLGGKLEPDEDVVAGLRREIREEAGIECERLRLAGTISWPGFGKDGETNTGPWTLAFQEAGTGKAVIEKYARPVTSE